MNGLANAFVGRAYVHQDWSGACHIPSSSAFLTLFVRYRRAAVENKIAVERVLRNEASLTVEVEQTQRLSVSRQK
jgi:hypothetical protein